MAEISSTDHISVVELPPGLFVLHVVTRIQLLSSCGSVSSTRDHQSHYQRKAGQEGCPGCSEGLGLIVAYIISPHIHLTKFQSLGSQLKTRLGNTVRKYYPISFFGVLSNRKRKQDWGTLHCLCHTP